MAGPGKFQLGLMGAPGWMKYCGLEMKWSQVTLGNRGSNCDAGPEVTDVEDMVL